MLQPGPRILQMVATRALHPTVSRIPMASLYLLLAQCSHRDVDRLNTVHCAVQMQSNQSELDTH